MRFIQIIKAATLMLAACLAIPVHACPPPPPEPEPPAAPTIERMEGETTDAFRIRTAPLIEEHRRQLAAFLARREQAKAEEARRVQAWKDNWGAQQDAQFDAARFVVLARVDRLSPLSNRKVRVRFGTEALLKGDGRIGTLAYTASAFPATSCSSYDPGVQPDANGYLIFLKKRQPSGPPDGTRWNIVRVSDVHSPKLKALVTVARNAKGAPTQP